MRAFLIIAILCCVLFPVFSQSAANDRFQALSDSMGQTISNTNYNLEYYDEHTQDNGNTKTFTSYNRKHEVLKQDIETSGSRLDLLIRTNDRAALVKEERDHYEKLLKDMESLKSDYDSWLRNVK